MSVIMLMVVIMMVMTMMMAFGRTGRIIHLSTPRLPMIATASPPQNHPPGNINRQPRHLLSKRHRLAQIRKVIRKIRPFRHNSLLKNKPHPKVQRTQSV
jgi:hypothetical protein